jgi:bifunctional DNase/RNase
MSKLIEAVIDSLRVSLTNQQRLVILREKDGERYLPIWIGPFEAESITIALQEVEVARPLTHDLLKNVFNILDAKLIQVEVASLKDDVFYGRIITEVNGQRVSIDSRPSDAIALAVRAHIPILIDNEVLQKAGITPEEDLIEEKPARSSEPPQTKPLSPEKDEASLSVFEDFLDKLNLDDLSTDDKTKGDDPQP